MQDPYIIAFLYSIPLIGIVWYISSRPDLSISPGITWMMFIVTFFLSFFAGEVNGIIYTYDDGISALSLAAFNEELFKFIMLLIFIPTFKDSLDLKKAFFLGATCCLSFAVIENYFYIIDSEILPGLLALVRVVMPSPMHFLTGGIIAIYSYQHFVIGKNFNYVLRGLIIGTVIHIVYNIGAGTSTYLSALAIAGGVIAAMTSFRAFDENETITTEDEETISFRAKTKTNDVRKDNLKIIKKKKEKDNIKIITKKK